MALKLITPPSILAVSLAEMKKHLRPAHDDDDDHIENLIIPAATAHVDGAFGWLQRALTDQTWELTLDTFPTNEVRLPLPPLIEVVSVKYDDDDGVAQTLVEDTDYTVDLVSEPGWVLPVTDSAWPTTFDGINAMRIRFRAGYVNAGFSPPVGEVPAPIKAALLLYGGSLYEHRETIVIGQTATQLPWAAEALLWPYRIFV